MSDLTLKLLAMILLAGLLVKLPRIGADLRLVNTLIHEMGHAVTALVTGGRVRRIDLYHNTEGLATSAHASKLGGILTSLAGYPAASLTGLLFTYWAATGHTDYVTYATTFIVLVGALLWVRNLYGLLWSAGTVALLIWLHTSLLPAAGAEWLAYGLCGITLTASLSTAYDVLKLSVKTPRDAGDATSLAGSALLPAPVWGAFFFLQALACTSFGIWFVVQV